VTDVLHAEVPAELADELIAEGFDEFIAVRGVLTDTVTVLSVASVGLAAGANVATILVAREAADQFVASLRNWFRRKAASESGSELTIDVLARHRDRRKHLQVRLQSSDGLSDADMTSLTALVTSLFDENPHGTQTDVTPASG
jgi:hypothetical protein